ncbi:MAG: hypothetical protein KDI90_04200 [Alphaproteobacteria bacterium]|nr:hypothetical protein [Alphaproteobacteria bacterium]
MLFGFSLSFPLLSRAEETVVDNSTAQGEAVNRPVTTINVPVIDLDKNGLESANIISFNLGPRQVALTPDQIAFLEKHALRHMKENKDIKLVVQTLARTNPSDRYEKTRIALARGLEVRQFFMDHGISPKRLRTQPLPVEGQRGEDDRIDLIFTR